MDEQSNKLQTMLDKILEDKSINLTPNNLREGTICLGIEGKLQERIDESDATATADDILMDKTAYINGEKVTGTIPTTPLIYGTKFREVGHNANQIYFSFYPAKAYYDGTKMTSFYIPLQSRWHLATDTDKRFAQQLMTELNIKASDLKAGKRVLHLTGTLDYNTKAEFIVPEEGCYNGQYQRFLTKVDADTLNKIAENSNNWTSINTTKENFMFKDCANLKEIPSFNTSSLTSMYGMFLWCTNLLEIPEIDTSNVTFAPAAFKGCYKITTMPLLDFSKITNLYEAFRECHSLESIPQFNTSRVTNMGCLFEGCTNLITVPILNMSAATNIINMFNECPSLSDESLNNILAMCTNTTSYTKTKTLAYIGLTSDQATRCQSLSNYDAFIAAGWTTGY